MPGVRSCWSLLAGGLAVACSSSGGSLAGPDASPGADASPLIDAPPLTDAGHASVDVRTQPAPRDAASSTEAGEALHTDARGPDSSGARVAGCSSKTKAGVQYCGSDEIDGGDPETLYSCAGPSSAPTAVIPCASGCLVEPAGVEDRCKTPASASDYRLPWSAGVTMQLTQDCNDSCCNDHVGNDEYAWDWANGTSFLVRAARAGTITHLKLSSTTGCATTACSADANMIVVDHGDGTQATYMHLVGGSGQAGVACGAAVTQGEPLAMAGTTGHSTGLHMHFQVNPVHVGAPTCECGADGLGCAGDWSPFPDVWVDATHASVPVAFEEWPDASTCADRRLTMPSALSGP